MRSVCLPRELSGFRLPRVRKVLTILQARLSSNARAAAGIGFFSVRIWLEQKGSRSPLHNRLRPIHFINPESIRGCQPLQVTRVSLQNCNDWQEKFLGIHVKREDDANGRWNYEVVVLTNGGLARVSRDNYFRRFALRLLPALTVDAEFSAPPPFLRSQKSILAAGRSFRGTTLHTRTECPGPLRSKPRSERSNRRIEPSDRESA